MPPFKINANYIDKKTVKKALESRDDELTKLTETFFKNNQRFQPEDYYKEVIPPGLPSNWKEIVQKFSKETQYSYLSKLAEIVFEGKAPPVSYDDGDQSPVMDLQSQEFLLIEWENCILHYNTELSWMSDWSRVLYNGDYQGMMNILRNKSEEETKMLLKKRESFGNFGALFHLVRGARCLSPEEIAENGSKTYLKKYKMCLLRLISLGAELNDRDMAGYTPLHHCISQDANEITFGLAETLLKANADVHARSRSGVTPLIDATSCFSYDLIQLLLDHGADPYMGDYSEDGLGMIPIKMATLFPRIQEMFAKANKKQQKTDRDKIKETEGVNNCNVCEKEENGNKRCSGCYIVFYCGRECQVKDWDDHKDKCKQIQKEYKVCHVSLKLRRENPLLWFDKKFASELLTHRIQPKGSKKSHFVVKISKIMDMSPNMGEKVDENNPLTIYNRDKSLVGFIEKEFNVEIFSQIVETVKTKGWKGSAAFFYAIIEKSEAVNNNVTNIAKINTAQVLPVESW